MRIGVGCGTVCVRYPTPPRPPSASVPESRSRRPFLVRSLSRRWRRVPNVSMRAIRCRRPDRARAARRASRPRSQRPARVPVGCVAQPRDGKPLSARLCRPRRHLRAGRRGEPASRDLRVRNRAGRHRLDRYRGVQPRAAATRNLGLPGEAGLGRRRPRSRNRRRGRPSGATYAGRVVTFVGSSGSGNSTLVAAVAHGIAADGRAALVVDLDPVSGKIPAVLGAEARAGLPELLESLAVEATSEPEPAIEAERLEALTVPVASGISLIGYPRAGSLPEGPPRRRFARSSGISRTGRMSCW